MLKADSDFSDTTLSGEERLANLLALNHALVLAMGNLFQRVDAYHDLLEEEIGESRSAAEYFGKSRDSVMKGLEWLKVFERKVHVRPEFEAFAIGLMVEAAVDRCRKILPNAAGLRSRARRSAGSAWATLNWPHQQSTSGTSGVPVRGWPTC